MRSRVPAVLCFIALAATLWAGAMHRHTAPTPGADAETAACAYCAGSLSTATSIRFEPVVRTAVAQHADTCPEAPSIKPFLPLAHSGNAPPA